MFFLKLSRNSSRSCDWFGGGNKLFGSLEMSPSDQDAHKGCRVPQWLILRVSITLLSKNNSSICLRSRSDTASPFMLRISLPTRSPGSMWKERKGKKKKWKKKEGNIKWKGSQTKLYAASPFNFVFHKSVRTDESFICYNYTVCLHVYFDTTTIKLFISKEDI